MGEVLVVALTAAMILGVGLCARLTEGSWVAPAAFFSLLWAVVSLCAGLVFVGLDGIFAGLLWVLLAACAVYGGTLLCHAAPRPRSAPGELSPVLVLGRLPFLRGMAILSALAGAGEVIFLFWRQGFALRAVLSYAAIAQLTLANRSDFIYGDMTQSRMEWIVFLLLYLGALLGGVLFRLATSKVDRLLAVLPLAMLVIVFGLFGSRMGALYGGSFWVAAYLATSVLFGEGVNAPGPRLLLKVGLASALLLFGLSVGTQVLRYSMDSAAPERTTMLADGVSFFAAFGIWFQAHGPPFSDLLYGARTFRKVVSLVGIEHPPALSIDIGFTSSNIYTVFRDLIEDFGSFGAVLFLAGYGFLGRLAFTRVSRGHLGSVPLLTLVFAFALTSVASSIFFYTVTTVAVCLYFLYFAALARRQERESTA
jgi:oligosaccharide repeat unit polymerase